MNKDEKFVITINRELGSGGRTIGRKLAQKLGVGFYDTIVINGLQEKFHLCVEEIEKLKGQKQGWWAEFKRTLLSDPSQNAHYYMPIQGGEPIKLFPETLFQTETEILKGIAESESCVVAGRSGFFVLRNHPNHLSIMIKASMEHRLERVMRTQNMTKEEALKTPSKRLTKCARTMYKSLPRPHATTSATTISYSLPMEKRRTRLSTKF